MHHYAIIPSDGAQSSIEAGIARLTASIGDGYTVIKEFDMGYRFHSDFKVLVIEPWLLSTLTCDRGRSGGRNDNPKQLRIEYEGKFAFNLKATSTPEEVNDVIEIFKKAHHAGWKVGYDYAWDSINANGYDLVKRAAA